VRAFDAQNAGVPLKVMRKIMENVSTAMVVLFIKTPPDIIHPCMTKICQILIMNDIVYTIQ
jgi:hypothetical protein